MSDAELTTPVIENLHTREVTVTLYVDMNLAEIPVTVTGQYNVHSNSFWPAIIFPTIKITGADGTIAESRGYDFEELCQIMGWDHEALHTEIQQAVEKRG